MPPQLDYQSLAHGGNFKPKRAGMGYFAIVTLNLLGPLVGGYVFLDGCGGDVVGALVVGLPLVLAEGFLCAIPAVFYLDKNHDLLTKRQRRALIILYLLPMLLAFLGIGIGLLPFLRTHPH
jgi:hypothetical protein